jgi:sugar phosphate isomerase/epimerase
MPKLAVFPKAYMKALCKDGTMKISEWIAMASKLEVAGLEWYADFIEMEDQKKWPEFKKMVEDTGKEIPMMCCSPDFTHPDKKFRKNEVDKQKKWIDMITILGGKYCRVLSGQKRPGLSLDEGIKFASDSINECLPYAKSNGITLILENHYKDDFWEYPEFAQKKDVFKLLVESINHPNFGVNFDPSNAFLAGEDPLDLLYEISDRIVTMHASDRYLKYGTIDDLRDNEAGVVGYAKMLSHGEVGKGMNNYDLIFKELKRVGFDSWISIEDGVDGFDQLERSVNFVNKKILEYWK